MTRKRIELAPVALYSLAAGALSLSWIALELGVDRPATDAPPPRRSIVADVQPVDIRPYLAAKELAVQLAARPAPPYRPALAAIAPRPADFVRCTPGPVVTPSPAPATKPLAAIVPTRPLWTAADAPRWRLLGVDTLAAARQGGQALAGVSNRAAERLTLQPLTRAIASLRPQPQPEPEIISSPPSLSRAVRVGPEDRLALASEAARHTKPSLSIRQRDALDGLLDDLALDEERVSTDSLLRSQLAALTHLPAARPWAGEALRLLDQLQEEDRQDAGAYAQTAEAFARHAELGLEQAEAAGPGAVRVPFRKAAYAVQRRARTWGIAARLEERGAMVASDATRATDNELRRRLRNFTAAIGNSEQGDGWRRYLKVMQLEQSIASGPHTAGDARQDLAREILARLAVEALDADQRRFAATGVVAALTDELHLAAADPVDVTRLVNDLELYELKPEPALAERIAMRGKLLSRSSAEGHQQLADQINHNYRNANLRVAIASGLLQRMLPQPDPQTRPVNDRIAGTPVRGSSFTETDLALRLTPDPHAWRITLEARGAVSSQTVANGGPARLSTVGDTSFVAAKPLIIRRDGLHEYAAQCQADSRSQLVGMRTDFDGVPLVSSLVRSRVEDEYRRNKSRARWETERKVSDQVSQSLDEEAGRFVTQLRERFDQTVTARAEALRLDVEPVEVRTTDSRLIARLRLANDRQLGSHTPRNRAPADSVVSLQLHESMLNNALEGLDLSRGMTTPEELRAALAERLAVQMPVAEQQERDVRLSFSPERAARVRLNNGKVELVLGFDELRVDASRFRNFLVHVSFTPRATVHGVWLEQERPVQIEGRMRAARRAQLHAVFGKIMPPGRTITVASTTPEQRRKLAGLMVTQVVVDDGWLGMALGPQQPQRTAVRERFVR